MIVSKLKARLLSKFSLRSDLDALPSYRHANEELPLRAELYSVEQLERHARQIASIQQLQVGKAPDKLLPRLAENNRVLNYAYALITQAVERKRHISPADEWLLDNFYFIEEQIRSTRQLLPRSYSGELPRLATGVNTDEPRAYGIATELVAHTDGRVDAASLNGFVTAFQTVVPLKLGELWAIPLMMRLALIENLRRVASRLTAARHDRDLATDWSQKMIVTMEQSPSDLILILSDLARSNPQLSGAFLAEFTRNLQSQNLNFVMATNWLDQRLLNQGTTIEQLVQASHQEQASDQVSIGNSITSLRFLSSNDWRKFVCEQSLVERTLTSDPAGAYARMDFATRDRYRHAVEAIAKRAKCSEYDVSNRAVQLAHAESLQDNGSRKTHVGYFLIDDGRPALERLVRMRLNLSVVVEKLRRQFPLAIYLVCVLALSVVAIIAIYAWTGPRETWWLGVLLLLPITVCGVQLGVSLGNFLATLFIKPQAIPRMDYRLGIPDENQTLVVIPTMLSSSAGIDKLIERMELHYLANRDKALRFALLTDLEDASSESLATDARLVEQVSKGVDDLNKKYLIDRPDIFFLLHRSRSWNKQERVWMGYERKRGKLADLNATLRGTLSRFTQVIGDVQSLQSVRFVITLDTDTQLPRDAGKELVGAMAHPLNRPVVDPSNGRVVSGYSILQPRVAVSLPSANRSWFVRIFGSDAGIDPYTRVVSDLYQDLFGEGSFIGKGIYDVDAFERHCSNFPENRILSHDLLESCHCRSALLTDVVLYEDFPSSYAADVARRHRWMRGDWQIATWIGFSVPSVRNAPVPNPISALSRWKIFDNLRRSIVPSALLSTLVLGWLLGAPQVGFALTVFVLCVVFLPSLLSALVSFSNRSEEIPIGMHLRSSLRELGKPLAQSFLSVAFLPHDAHVSCDAIIRTLTRLYWTNRLLLEWRTSSDADRMVQSDLSNFGKKMAIAPLLSVPLAVSLSIWNPEALRFAAPILLLWLISPMIAWFLSRPIRQRVAQLTTSQTIFLRGIARKTWRYFEVFVTAKDNWLPPDNIQVNPNLVIASRTSPTNIGMALLSDLSATDFGFCTIGRFLDRTGKAFVTMNRLERYRGHFFNWYDTRSLEPLAPRYVSTVDSGNLIGHLFVLSSGLKELAEAEVLPKRLFLGLCDTLRIVLEEGNSGDRTVSGATERTRVDAEWARSLQRLIEELEAKACTLDSLLEFLPKVERAMLASRTTLAMYGDAREWAAAIESTCQDALQEVRELASWRLHSPQFNLYWTQDDQETWKLAEILQSSLFDPMSLPSLREVATLPVRVAPVMEELRRKSTGNPEAVDWLQHLECAVNESSQKAGERIRELGRLSEKSIEFANLDFEFLLSKTQDLFSIGFNVNENKLDSGSYDLLASEARLSTFVLIAQGHLGQEHWFALGRSLTIVTGAPALLSWSGSMFEYLMPLLVMPTYEHTLLDQTYQSVVRRQIIYGRQRGVPWGISESGYNTVDLHLNYQYRAFGVPGLGLKRGLATDLVIAPYASALALMVSPEASCRNLQRLYTEERCSTYGFFEAVDYTPSRCPPNVDSVTVRQYMGHHAGMTLLSIAYGLLDKPMQRRFDNDPAFRAANLLLHERIPKNSSPVYPHALEVEIKGSQTAADAGMMRVFSDPQTPFPEVHLLSNGSYHVMVTNAGGGYSRWRDLAVTRWREDSTRDFWGTFCYIRDVDSGHLWSSAFQPTLQPTKSYEAIFTQARAEYRGQFDQIEMHSQISVSSEDDLELRRVTLTNRSDRVRTIEFTSYAEVVLATQSQDESHPAFSNLFVQTEIDRRRQAILCTRRPRSAEEHPPWLIHMMTASVATTIPASYETDRNQFVGRNRSLARPAAFDHQQPLTDTAGATLDPIVSIRQTLRIEPNDSVHVDLVIGVAETRMAVEAMGETYSDPSLADRLFELVWMRGPIELQQLNASEADAQAYGRLASSIIYCTSLRRANVNSLARNYRNQSALWGYGISGDLPIMLVRIRSGERIELVRQAIQAHAFWRMKGLSVDLVIWNEDDSIYRQTLQDSILDVVAMSPEAGLVDRPGGIFYRRGEQMSVEDRLLLQTVARVVLIDDAGTLSEQVERRARTEPLMPILVSTQSNSAAVQNARRRGVTWVDSNAPQVDPSKSIGSKDLEFFNGLGGFSHDGREYICLLDPGVSTPAPWINVIANEQLGFVVSESGNGYTFAQNSHEFRLTPWTNDPVMDGCGEAIYLRDEESGKFWSPSPSPVRGANRYVARHGFGYSIFDYTEDGITTELCLFVAVDQPVKISRIKITNHSGRTRHLSLTGYWEWVLGDLRNKTAMHVVTELDPATGAILARNPYSSEFGNSVVFARCSENHFTCTGDRKEFLGRNGTLSDPAAMRRSKLSNRLGAGLDPCTAIQTQISIEEGATKWIEFTIGSALNEGETRALISRTLRDGFAQQCLEGVWHYWSQTLGAVHVETPDSSVNYLANGWLLYQTLACRMWARTGFYQSGGAYGYRDQLQDSMALVHAEPGLLRSHILRAASRQFREGDVQHWWHPPGGRGVRTQISDDFLWLPRAVCRYVSATGDIGVLDEAIPFLSARPLHADEEAFYDLPQISEDVGSLYDHAIRAMNHALRFGEHGLPLMGSGDWNDGMNLVGQHGSGESVWLAFFLYDTLNQFAELARSRSDQPTADRFLLEAGRLRGNIESQGWDGQWYLRAYFDDGTPLGSARNPECQIDSISQSWAVMSGAGTRERTTLAMDSVNRRLVRRADQLIQLLDPPFDKSDLNPGYIKGYVPGVRENGGQYTHAAIWTAMAFSELGDSERAWELFQLINPIHHSSTSVAISRYRVEPYVVAADVYGVAPHIGRGGWTWYTGSAGWMYRLITESLIGLHLEAGFLRVTPKVPKHWSSFKIHYRFYQTTYHLEFVANPDIESEFAITRADGTQELNSQVVIPLENSGGHHEITVEFRS